MLGWLSPSKEGSTLKTVPSSASVISAIVPQFIKVVPPKSESSYKVKVDVLSDLERKKDRLVDQLRESFTANSNVDQSTVDTLCSDLDKELRMVIVAYMKPITDAAINLAKTRVRELLPRNISEIGLSLPVQPETQLDECIDRKRRTISTKVMQSLENYHFSWYAEDVTVFLDQEIQPWIEQVRTTNTKLSRRWSGKMYLYVFVMPVVIAIAAALAMKGCRPGQHIVLPPHIRIAINAIRSTLPESGSSTSASSTETKASAKTGPKTSTKASAKASDSKESKANSVETSLARWVHYALPSKDRLLEEMELLKQLAKDSTPSLCAICPTGMYSYGLFSTSCQVCPKGTYSSAPGAFYCSKCPSNSVAIGSNGKGNNSIQEGSTTKGSTTEGNPPKSSSKEDNVIGKGGSSGSISTDGGATGCKCKKGYRSIGSKGKLLQCKSIKEITAAAAAAAAAANRKNNGTNNDTQNGVGNKKMGGGDGSEKGKKKKSTKNTGKKRPFRIVTAADIQSTDPLTLEEEVKRLADEVAHHNATVIQARQLAAEEEKALLLKKQQLEEELRKAQELYRETAEAADAIRRIADGKVNEIEAEEARKIAEEQAAAMELQLQIQREEEERIAAEIRRAEEAQMEAEAARIQREKDEADALLHIEEEKQRMAAEEAIKIEETKRFLIEEAARVALLREEAEEQIRVAMLKANETMAEVQKLEKLRAEESLTANSNKKRVKKEMKSEEAKHAAKRTAMENELKELEQQKRRIEQEAELARQRAASEVDALLAKKQQLEQEAVSVSDRQKGVQASSRKLSASLEEKKHLVAEAKLLQQQRQRAQDAIRKEGELGKEVGKEGSVSGVVEEDEYYDDDEYEEYEEEEEEGKNNHKQ